MPASSIIVEEEKEREKERRGRERETGRKREKARERKKKVNDGSLARARCSRTASRDKSVYGEATQRGMVHRLGRGGYHRGIHEGQG